MVGVVLDDGCSLFTLGKRKVLDYYLGSFVEAFEEVLVLGFRDFEELFDHVERFYGSRIGVFVKEDAPPPSLLSLVGEILRGKSFFMVRTSFLLPEEAVSEILRNGEKHRITLGAYRDIHVLEDDVKLSVNRNNLLISISPKLKNFHGIFTGACLVPKDLTEDFIETCSSLGSLSDAFLFIPSKVCWLDEYPPVRIRRESCDKGRG